MLTTSVAVVRKIDEAVAGSAPSRFNVVGNVKKRPTNYCTIKRTRAATFRASRRR